MSYSEAPCICASGKSKIIKIIYCLSENRPRSSQCVYNVRLETRQFDDIRTQIKAPVMIFFFFSTEQYSLYINFFDYIFV